MGCGASTNIRSASQNQWIDGEDGDIQVLCENHGETVSHFNMRTEELYCWVCCVDNKIKNPRSHNEEVYETINVLKTDQFKQMESETLKDLRSRHHTIKSDLLQNIQTCNSLQNKETSFLKEIREFVNTVLDLIKHLEDEMCQEIRKKLAAAIEELEDIKLRLKYELTTLEIFTNNIIDNKSNENRPSRLTTVVKCRRFLKHNTNIDDKITDYEPVLNLNKDLSLNDIIGKKDDMEKVRLGNVTYKSTEDNVTAEEIKPTTVIRYSKGVRDRTEGKTLSQNQIVSRDTKPTTIKSKPIHFAQTGNPHNKEEQGVHSYGDERQEGDDVNENFSPEPQSHSAHFTHVQGRASSTSYRGTRTPRNSQSIATPRKITVQSKKEPGIPRGPSMSREA